MSKRTREVKAQVETVETKPVKKGRAAKAIKDVEEQKDEETKLVKRGRLAKDSKKDNAQDEEIIEAAKPVKKGKPAKSTTNPKNNIEDKTNTRPVRKVRATPQAVIDDKSDEESDPVKKKKPKTTKAATKTKDAGDKAPVKNKTTTSYEGEDFSICESKNGKPSNFKISNWNVDGIRAWLKKGGIEYIDYEKPDILCLQETKCNETKLPDEVKEIEGYKAFWHCSQKEGYAGVGLLSRTQPLSVSYGIGVEEHDSEGRMITAEYEKFYVISVYVPNAGRGLVTLDKRLDWNEHFRNYIAGLDKKKPVIICGDMNVAHTEIDLQNPKTNTKNAGFTKEEREGMTEFLSDKYIDTYRHLYPDKKQAYTFWTYMSNCRAKNIGWRLDYIIVSKRMAESICDNIIRSQVFGSDHCPITLFLSV